MHDDDKDLIEALDRFIFDMNERFGPGDAGARFGGFYGDLPELERVPQDEAVRLMVETAKHAQWQSWDEALKRLERKHGVRLMRPKPPEKEVA